MWHAKGWSCIDCFSTIGILIIVCLTINEKIVLCLNSETDFKKTNNHILNQQFNSIKFEKIAHQSSEHGNNIFKLSLCVPCDRQQCFTNINCNETKKPNATIKENTNNLLSKHNYNIHLSQHNVYKREMQPSINETNYQHTILSLPSTQLNTTSYSSMTNASMLSEIQFELSRNDSQSPNNNFNRDRNHHQTLVNHNLIMGDNRTINTSIMVPIENGTCNEPSCINHTIVCVGDPDYCNYTYEEYVEMLYDYIYPTVPEWILIFSHAVVFFMGLVGNALVCIAVYTNCTMRTVTNIFIVNLAVADFFVILFCLPPTVLWDVTETWFMGEAMCKVVLYFQTVSVTVSVLTLTFISIDRWYAICFPLRYVSTNVRAIGSIAFIWIVALLSDIPEFIFSTTKHKELRFGIDLFTQCVSTWEKDTEKMFYIGRFIVLYVLPLLMMTVAYFQIVRVLWKSDTIPGHRESRNQTYTCGYLRSTGPAANSSTMGQLRARRKAAKMLVAVVVMFASCYFPVHVLNILRYTIDIGQNEVVTVLSLFSHWLCYANSAINPVIYNFMSGKFRREFRNALEKCRCGRARIEDRSLYHSTPATRINNISPSTRSNYQLTSVRDMTSLRDRQTLQTSFVENCGNGLHDITPSNKIDDRLLHNNKYDNGA